MLGLGHVNNKKKLLFYFNKFDTRQCLYRRIKQHRIQAKFMQKNSVVQKSCSVGAMGARSTYLREYIAVFPLLFQNGSTFP